MTTDVQTCGECSRRTADVQVREGGPAVPVCNLCWDLGQIVVGRHRRQSGEAQCPWCEGPLNWDGSCAASCVGVGDPA